MAIISALSDLAGNITKALGTLWCKDVVINKSGLKYFYTNLKKKKNRRIKRSKEKATHDVMVNAACVTPPMKRIFQNPQGLDYVKNQCQNLSLQNFYNSKTPSKRKKNGHLF